LRSILASLNILEIHEYLQPDESYQDSTRLKNHSFDELPALVCADLKKGLALCVQRMDLRAADLQTAHSD